MAPQLAPSVLAAPADLKKSAGAIVRVNDQVVSGAWLNSDGNIAVPAVGGETDDWTVEFEGERYPAAVTSFIPKYGLCLLKVNRQQSFVPVTLGSRQPPAQTKLILSGIDAEGAPKQVEAGFGRVRRRVSEKGKDGSYYEINAVGTPPQPGALMIDATTGEIYGMLTDIIGENGERYVLFASSLGERAAAADVTLGISERHEGPNLVFADGKTAPATVRTLEFRAASSNRESVAQMRSVQNWRKYTGFWINFLTTPYVEGSNCYFGATNGMLYCVDLNTMQRVWIFENEWPVVFTPTVTPRTICTVSGAMMFDMNQSEEEIFGGLLGSRWKVSREIRDVGYINCIDRRSGVFKWRYESRFLSEARVVGDRVVFAGMGTYGVLNNLDGKELWVENSGKTRDPEFHTLAGANQNRFWVLSIPTKVTGKRTVADPLKLEQDSGNVSAQCFSTQANGQNRPLWSTNIRTAKPAPALSAQMMMSPDEKICYGATSKDVFALNAETGALLWQTPTFAQNFGGNLAYEEGIVYATSTDNKLIAINAQNGQIIWTFEAKLPIAVPLAKDGVVYAGSLDTWIYALDARTGRPVWKMETGGRLCGRPTVLGDKLYCMSDDGRLTEIALPK